MSTQLTEAVSNCVAEQLDTIKEFDEICRCSAALRAKKDELDKEVKDVSEQLEEYKAKILSYLEHYEKTKYIAAGYTFYIQERFPVKMPQDLEKKETFFSFLKDRGIYNELITVNSQTLNSFYSKEMEKAIEEGNVDFKVPGIDEPKVIKNVMMRKA